MEGSFSYSPFYPQSGGGTPSTFKIGSFESNRQFNEIGVTVTDVTFDWMFLNGTPNFQSIMPLAGNINPSLRTHTLTGQDIKETMVFTLQASDGNVSRTMSTRLLFYHPIYYGVVSGNIPSEAEILSMNKRVADFTTFTVGLNIADQHSCFVSPMANPIVDIREKVFGSSILGSYNIINNYFLTMADGFAVPCRVLVKRVPEHTSGMVLNLDVIF